MASVWTGGGLRHGSLRSGAGISAARTVATSKTAEGTVTVKVGVEGAFGLPSEIAQQLSACAWVTTRWPSPSRESDLCIGHSGSSQHAMRASGVGAQPAQRAALPTTSARVSARTDVHRLKVTTLVGCLTTFSLSNAANRPPPRGGRR